MATGRGISIKTITQNIQINYAYKVYFQSGIFLPQNWILRDVAVHGETDLPKRLFFVIDAGLVKHHPHLSSAIAAYCRFHAAKINLCGPPLVMQGGEAVKNNQRDVTRVQRALQEAGLCRHSYVVAVGGGALIDTVGYAAATVHRGLRLIRVPTTVLAQADGALGVKNGINAFGKKNLLGTFAPPWAVINDDSFLTTLSGRDWLGGVSEAIKVALIKDAAFFRFLEKKVTALKQRDMGVMGMVIRRSALLHLNHIAGNGDPFELGSSRPLDFGHWAAHKLEQMGAYRLRHGEAVAIGMAIDATYSYLAGLLNRNHWQRILQALTSYGFPLHVPELYRTGDLLTGLQEFQEHLGGTLTIMLLEGIGRGREVHQLDHRLITEALVRLREIAQEAA